MYSVSLTLEPIVPLVKGGSISRSIGQIWKMNAYNGPQIDRLICKLKAWRALNSFCIPSFYLALVASKVQIFLESCKLGSSNVVSIQIIQDIHGHNHDEEPGIDLPQALSPCTVFPPESDFGKIPALLPPLDLDHL